MGAEHWVDSTLGAIADEEGYGLVDGPFGSNLPASDYVESGIPVIRGSNLSLGTCRFNDSDFVFVSPKTAKRLSRSLCYTGDIIFTKKGTLGQTGFVPLHPHHCQFLLSSNQMKLTVNPKLADPLFTYYYISSPWSREKIVRDAEMTGVPKTNVAYFRKFPIRLPPLIEQQAIACILGSLDDKIELNRRMNRTLEEMARAIFKSWFVDFDPVRAKAAVRQAHPKWSNEKVSRAACPNLKPEIATLFPDAFQDSELGKIPEGWEVGTIGEVADHPRRGIQPKEIDTGTPYIALEHMPKQCIALSDWGTAEGVGSNKFEFRTGEILFGKLRPYFHKVGVAPIDGVCSTDIVVMAPRADNWFGFVLFHVSSNEFVEYANAGSTGTKMPRTSWGEMARYPLVIPAEPVSEAFNRQVQPVIHRIRRSIYESRTLAVLRDALLPKLISGEIRVAEEIKK